MTVAVFLGLVGETLFYDAPWGLNVLLWTVFLVGASLLTAVTSGGVPTVSAVALSLAALVFGAGFAVNDSWGMSVVNVLGLGTCLALLTTHSWGRRIRDMNVLDASVGVMTTWLGYVVDAFVLFFSELGWTEMARKVNTKQAAPYVRGLLVAVPLILVFGGLFASADAVFRSYVARPFSFDGITGAMHFGLFVTFFVIGAGVVRRAVLGEPVADCTIKPSDQDWSKYSTEASVVLGALNLLFAGFVIVQFGHLFGGRGTVGTHAGLSYSEYAREGFFQLVTVVALSVPLLALADRVSSGRPLSRWLSLAMVVQLGVVMASAFLRMGLYVSYAGLSELRLYPSAFMVWLAVVIIAVTLKSVTGKEGRPVLTSVAAALVIGIGLNVLRPGVFIAETNYRLAKSPEQVDTDYLMTLGADAGPTLVRTLPRLTGDRRHQVAVWLRNTADSGRTDWRGANLSRTSTVAAVADHQDIVDPARDGTLSRLDR